MSWKPKRTVAECNAMLIAPGQLHELEYQIVDGRVLKVYKNLWPSLRAFFLSVVKDHSKKDLLVFENERFTYQQTYEQALRAAGIMRDTYGIKKGDRVAIVSRNYPEYIVAFWATQLIGAVSVFVNAWLPEKPLHHCLNITQPKIVIVDPERAPALNLSLLQKKSGTRAFFVFHPHEFSGALPSGLVGWDQALAGYPGDAQSVMNYDPFIQPEDNATIFFTSGTTGLPKGVLSTHRGFLANTLNCLVAKMRSYLRKGETPPPPDPTQDQKGLLLATPFFHATGLTALTMLAHLGGVKIVMMRKWDTDDAARLIKEENIGTAGGVPSIVLDLIESPAAGAPSIDGFLFGGAPAHAGLALLAQKTFPKAIVSQGYGMTEMNAAAVTIAGEDYVDKPTSTGLPAPINDLVIVKDGKVVKTGEVGEVWLRGCNIMREYWADPEATRKAITDDGYFKTGDLGYVDAEGFLYIKDRLKDIIIRGGENIDSTTVENAIYADDRVMEVAAIGVPDRRLGELVAVVVTLKKRFRGQMKEEQIIQLAGKSLPKFAVPVMVIIKDEPLERNPAGKILKPILRKLAAREWEGRLKGAGKMRSKTVTRLQLRTERTVSGIQPRTFAHRNL